MGLSIFADPSPDVTPLPIETVIMYLKPFDEDAALRYIHLCIHYALLLRCRYLCIHVFIMLYYCYFATQAL